MAKEKSKRTNNDLQNIHIMLRFSGTYVRYALLKKMFGGLKLSPLGYISTKGPDTTYTKVSIVALRPFTKHFF
jgi:hypothetical protein